MSISKNNISKFERIIAEEWAKITEQTVSTSGGDQSFMTSPQPYSGLTTYDTNPPDDRFSSSDAGKRTSIDAHRFLNWLRKQDALAYRMLEDAFKNSPNASTDSPGSSAYHNAMWAYYKTLKPGSMIWDMVDKQLSAAPDSVWQTTYGGPADVNKPMPTPADISNAEYLDSNLTPEWPGASSLASQIINTSAAESKEWFKFMDDEKAAFDLIINGTRNIREYYWLNAEVARRTGSKSIIGFLQSFSKRRTGFGSDVPLETWIQTLGYQENMDMKLADIELSDWDALAAHLKQLESQDPKLWNLAHYDIKGQTGKSGLDNIDVGKFLPLRDHIGLIGGQQAAVRDRKAEAQAAKEFKKTMVAGGFAVTQWVIDYLDEEPVDAMKGLGMVLSLGSGWIAMLLAAAATGTGVAIDYQNEKYAEAGNDFIWTAIFGISAIMRLPSVQLLRNSSKLRIANAWAKSDLSLLNQLESKAFADIANTIKNPGSKVSKEISKLLAQRTKNMQARIYANMGRNSAIGNIVHNVGTVGVDTFAEILKFADKSKYFSIGATGYWNWMFNWWPEIYMNEKVPGSDLTFFEMETLEAEGGTKDLIKKYDSRFEQTNYSFYDEEGNYIGITDEELYAEDF